MSSIPNSPSSSPPSSPLIDATDSSPPSSPDLAPITDSDLSPGPSHPFAASTKAVRSPHLYERQRAKRRRENDWALRSDPDNDIEPKCEDNVAPHRPGGSSDCRSGTASSSKIVDPFSASAKGIWVPPVYEKKARTYSRAISDTYTAKDISHFPDGTLQAAFVYNPPQASSSTCDQEDISLSELSANSSPISLRTRTVNVSTEEQQWELAINNAVAEANGFIDLRQD